MLERNGMAEVHWQLFSPNGRMDVGALAVALERAYHIVSELDLGEGGEERRWFGPEKVEDREERKGLDSRAGALHIA